MKRTIIINKMYTGKYLETGENIGHEIINLFKASDNRHYIYLNSKGTISSQYVSGAKTIYKTPPYSSPPEPSRIIDILLVRPINSHVLQILALAKNVAVLDSAIKPNATYKDAYGKDDIKARRTAQNFSYNDIEISKILSNNAYKDREGNDIFATFTTESELFKPIEPLFLCSLATQKGETEEATKQFQLIDGVYKTITTKNGFGIQSLRLYFTGEYNSENNSEAFDELSNIIDTDDYWINENESNKIDLSSFDFDTIKPNFLSIIKEEDRELTFSNLLQHFLSDKSILKDFCDEVLEADIDVKNADISVNREEHNIDLIIRDGKNIIVIENKILSGINGTNKNYSEQLNKIFGNEQDTVEDKNSEKGHTEQENTEQESKKEILEDLLKNLKTEAESKLKDNKLIISQLSKYYFYAQKIAVEEGVDKDNIKLYIICPQYQAKFYDKENLKQYLYGEEYTTKTYKDLLAFFEKHYNGDDFYLKEFIDAMRKHAQPTNSSKEDEMKSRFIKAIMKAKNENE